LSTHFLQDERDDATFARWHGAVFESVLFRAGPLAPNAGRAAGTLQPLRSAVAQRAAAARAAVPAARENDGKLSPDGAPTLKIFFA
jgi:hypothetical protein